MDWLIKENKQNISGEIYFSMIMKQMPRLLGYLDRNRLSPTYGCFDREYWHYASKDFPCARQQEAVLTLVIAYFLDHPANPYFKRESVLEMIRSGIMFWLSIQEKDGSFNEWYPRERSFVATAFSLYALSESLLLIGDKLSPLLKRKAVSCVEYAAGWLIKRHEHRAQNQESGAVIGLYNAYLLTNKNEYLKAVGQKIDFIKQHQREEGWFLEYGGADIGYLSLTIDYLAKYYHKSKDSSVLSILNKSLKFISSFVHPDLSFGGTYGSRNTEYIIPSGFEMLADENKDAAFVSVCVRSALFNSSILSLSSLDDRYLAYIGYTWLQAYLFAKDNSWECEEEAVRKYFDSSWKKEFNDAGILVVNDNQKHLIINYKKGGCFRLTLKNKGRIVVDSGIELCSGNKGMVSAWLGTNSSSVIREDEVEVKGTFCEVPAMLMSPLRTIQLRLFQMSVGRSSRAAFFIREKLRDLLITKGRRTHYQFHRTINVKDLTVKDSVSIDASVDELIVGAKSSYISVPSSRYFRPGDELLKPLTLRREDFGKRSHFTILRDLKNDTYSIL